MSFTTLYDEYEFEKEGENTVIMEHRMRMTGSLDEGKCRKYKIPVSLGMVEKVLSPICKQRRQWIRRTKLFLIAGPIVSLSVSPDEGGLLSTISLGDMIPYLENILHVKVTPFGGNSWEENCLKIFNKSKKSIF